MGMGAVLAPEVEIETPEVAEETVEAPEEAAPVTEPAAGATSAEKSNVQVAGVLKGIQAERSRRQFAENRLKEVEAELLQFKGEPAAPPQRAVSDPAIERKLLTISETSARTAHPDYTEKFQVFATEAESNPALYQMVMESDHPGEAAYQAGKNLMVQKKYGTDPEAMVKKIREETETEMKAKIRAELETEIKGKVQAKNNQPKNILAGRAAGGGETGEVPPIIGFGQLLQRRSKK